MSSEDILRLEIHKLLESIHSSGSTLFLTPFINRSKFKLVGFNIVCFLIFFTAIQLLFTLFFNGFHDLMEIINIAPNIGAALMAAMKYLKIHTNRQIYSKIFDYFRGDFWNLLPEHSKDNIEILTKYHKILNSIQAFLMTLTFSLIIIVDSFPWLIMMYEKYMSGNVVYLYPFDAWYPFDKVKWYYVAYIWESVMTAVVILLYAFANIVHLSFVTCICMELKLLGCWVEGLITKESLTFKKKGKISKAHMRVHTKLNMIIKRYNFLHDISSALDKVLGDVMLLSYGFGSIFICLTAYSTTVVEDKYKSVRYFSFFVSLIAEIFMQTFIGQVLIDHSKEFSQRVYNSDWFYACPHIKKNLLMLILRSQRPFKLSAKGYLVMDLNTFWRVCSSSYSYFNLLRKMYHPK